MKSSIPNEAGRERGDRRSRIGFSIGDGNGEYDEIGSAGRIGHPGRRRPLERGDPLGQTRQTLIVTQGHGFVQEWQRAAQAIGPGDVVWIPPGVKHWHGASAREAMTHVAIVESENNNSVTWMEKVSDAQYADAVRGHPR